MMTDYQAFITHLKKTGRLKLLPQVLRELREAQAREEKLSPKKETAKENPSLIAGWRSIENGILIDRSAKQSLLTIYQNVTCRPN